MCAEQGAVWVLVSAGILGAGCLCWCFGGWLPVQVFKGLAACAGVGLQCPAGAQSHGHP